MYELIVRARNSNVISVPCYTLGLILNTEYQVKSLTKISFQ